jgi:dynactin 1
VCQRRRQVNHPPLHFKPLLITHTRITAQFDHLAETYFSGFDYDLGERELGYLVSFDLDLDIFAASIGMTKTSIATLVQDDGTRFSSPLKSRALPMTQKRFWTWEGSTLTPSCSNRCRGYWISTREPKRCQSTLTAQFFRYGTDGPFRKLTKRLEDLIQDSTALKAHLVPQMQALSNFVPELVNFGISVRFGGLELCKHLLI